jgi:predicted ribosome quality control (RQC) complex YloA/Tae2 family protein
MRQQLEENLRLAERADEVEQLAALMMQDAANPGADAPDYISNWQAEHPDWAGQLEPEASLEQNALKLSRYAQRLRRGKAKLEARLKQAESASGQRAEDEREVQSAARRQAKATFARLDQKGIRHSRYRTTDGVDMVVGTSAASNDALLRVLGSGNHLWFHARDYAGSHVYLLQAGSGAPQSSIRQAAIAAAYFSQGRKEDKVDVSFAQAKQIRRPRNAKPGQVLLHTESVVTVRPALFRELQPQLSRADI